MAERAEELARVQTQIVERENALSVGERVKVIFKKYDVTVTSTFIAAGITIGIVVSQMIKALTAVGNGDGKRRKNARQEGE